MVPIDHKNGEFYDDGAQLDRDTRLPDFWQNNEEDCWVRIGDLVEPVVRLAKYAIDLRSECESPIEIALGAELKLFIEYYFPQVSVLLMPQYKLDRFRYDFAVKFVGDDKPAVLIECDGREFHSKPEDVANDKRKNEAAEKAGIRLLRFTGRDIHRNGRGCVLIVVGELLAHLRNNAA